MKFSSMVRGKRAERETSFPYPDESGELVDRKLLLVPLNGVEESQAIAFAAQYAKTHGGEPKPDDPQYAIGFMAQSLVFGCRDVDSPAAARESFFGNAQEVIDHLSRDQRVFLFELLEAWQSECSPGVKEMNADQLRLACALCARGGDEAEDFLGRLAPAMLRSFARTTGALSSTLLELRSPTSSASTTPTTAS